MSNYVNMNDKKHHEKLMGFNGKVSVFPPMVIIAYLYVCNSRCPYCPYTANPTARQKHSDCKYMPDDVFKKIADETGKYGSVLRFTGGGEPFLHKNIVEHTKYATTAGCKVSIITNGSMDVSGVLDVADMIEFSVDAGNAQDYAKARPGLKWDFLNENVINAIKTRKKTRIITSIINQKGIDIEQAKKHWGFVDAVQVRKFLSFGTNQDNSADKTAYIQDVRIPCPWPFDRLLINTKGQYTICNIDVGFDYAFSDINSISIKDAWHSKEMELLRSAHTSGLGRLISICRSCEDWKYRTWDYSYFKLREYADGNITA